MTTDTVLICFVLLFLEMFNSILKNLMTVQLKKNVIAGHLKKLLTKCFPLLGKKRSRLSLVKIERSYTFKISALDLIDILNLCNRKKEDKNQPPFMNVTIVYPLRANLKSFITATENTVKKMMENYWIRLSTFVGFPAEAPVSAIRLCDAGFYFENSEGDEVKCFQCGITYKGWRPIDVPILVHKTISPACEYIRDKLPPTGDEFGPTNSTVQQRKENSIPVNNASSQSIERGASGINNTMGHVTSVRAKTEKSKERPCFSSSQLATRASLQQAHATENEINLTVTSQSSISNDKDDLAVVQGNEAAAQGRTAVAQSSSRAFIPSALNAESLGVTTAKPQHQNPKVSVNDQRRQKFAGFPNNMNQTSEELAKAGLFYAGSNDCVRCFDCGGGLREWEPEDFSWVEHARWYQNMQLQKSGGDELITSVHNSQYEILRKEREQKAADEKKNYVIHLPTVVRVLEMGYPDNLVKQAYQRCVSEHGESIVTADVLIEAVFQLEEEEIQSHPINEANSTPLPKNDEIVEDLEEKNRILKERQICKICIEEEAAAVFLPCGHMVTCVSCAAAMRHCPICRTFIRGTNEVKCPNYKLYDTRLNSYKGFPDDLTQKPEELARAGFFYEGKGDRVKCFACGKRVSDWRIRGNPWTEHAFLSQKCEHLRQYNGDGVSKAVLYEPNNSTIVHSSLMTGNSQVTETAVGACEGSRDATRQTSINSVSASKCKQSSEGQSIKKKSQIGGRTSSVTQPVVVMLPGKSKTSKKTKTAKCKRKNNVNIALESSFTKDNNGVKQQTFVTAEEASSTNRSSSHGKANAPRNIHSFEALPNVSFKRSRAEGQQGNVNTNPQYQMYAAYTRRRQTFKEYPKDMNQKPEELATAGFFYTGEEDHVRCFYCGGELKEWESEDEPWTEHARWFPSCGYLRQSKGDEYIRKVHSGLRREKAQRRSMELAVINTIIDMGFPEDLVNQAFRKCAKEQGDSNVKDDELLQELLRQEEQNRMDISNEDDEGSNETPVSQKQTEPSEKIPSEIKQLTTDDIRELEEENIWLKEHLMCKICMQGETRAFFPCGHMATCKSGEAVLHNCPTCQVFLTMKCEENINEAKEKET